jgi:hypothetical protein
MFTFRRYSGTSRSKECANKLIFDVRPLGRHSKADFLEYEPPVPPTQQRRSDIIIIIIIIIIKQLSLMRCFSDRAS